MGLLSIKQVSNMLEVTPQAIYKRINDTENNNELINHMQTDDKGRKLIDPKGLEYLRQAFNKTTDIEPRNEFNNESNKELIETLRAELKRRDEEIKRLHDELENTRADYKDQLKIKDEQIENSHKLNENAQSIIYSMQQQQQALLEAPGRKGLFSWLKKGEKDGN